MAEGILLTDVSTRAAGECIDDLLTQLGVDPDDCGDAPHGDPVKVILARVATRGNIRHHATEGREVLVEAFLRRAREDWRLADLTTRQFNGVLDLLFGDRS